MSQAQFLPLIKLICSFREPQIPAGTWFRQLDRTSGLEGHSATVRTMLVLQIGLCLTSHLIEAAIHEHTYPPNPSCGGQASTDNKTTSTGLRKSYIQSNCACSVNVRLLIFRTTSHYGPPPFISQNFLDRAQAQNTGFILEIFTYLFHVSLLMPDPTVRTLMRTACTSFYISIISSVERRRSSPPAGEGVRRLEGIDGDCYLST